MSKEMWIAAYEQLAEEYLEENPEATEAEVEKYACDNAHDRSCDNMAAIADAWRDRVMEG